MKASGRDLGDIFGEPIAVYTRRQAIEDGVLVDLMQAETVRLVREAGFKFPVAMTAGAFAATVAEIGKPLPEGQDIRGRLWDVALDAGLCNQDRRQHRPRTVPRQCVERQAAG